jgi:hypothetical protein
VSSVAGLAMLGLLCNFNRHLGINGYNRIIHTSLFQPLLASSSGVNKGFAGGLVSKWRWCLWLKQLLPMPGAKVSLLKSEGKFGY